MVIGCTLIEDGYLLAQALDEVQFPSKVNEDTFSKRMQGWSCASA